MMKKGGYITALALVCVFAANVDAFAPPPLGALVRAPLRASHCASSRKFAVSPLRMQHSEVTFPKLALILNFQEIFEITTVHSAPDPTTTPPPQQVADCSARLLKLKEESGMTWDFIEQKLGLTDAYTCQIFLGQA